VQGQSHAGVAAPQLRQGGQQGGHFALRGRDLGEFEHFHERDFLKLKKRVRNLPQTTAASSRSDDGRHEKRL
jgi:hypothetical protein